jgi:hypothetical protein
VGISLNTLLHGFLIKGKGLNNEIITRVGFQGSIGDSAVPAVDEAGILENIKVSNLYSTSNFSGRNSYWDYEDYLECDDRSKLDDPDFDGDAGYPSGQEQPHGWTDETIGRLKKWDIASDGLIPVKHNNS